MKINNIITIVCSIITLTRVKRNIIDEHWHFIEFDISLLNPRYTKWFYREDLIDRLVRTFYPTTTDKRHVRQIVIVDDATPFSWLQKIFLDVKSVKVSCHSCVFNCMDSILSKCIMINKLNKRIFFKQIKIN